MSGVISAFLERHYKHFNAAVVVDAAQAWKRHLDGGGRMFLTMAGAMSTAELGKSVAELIRQGKVHGLSVTGANLEEDLLNLVAQSSYHRIPGYRDLSPAEESDLLERGLNRVTDTCIPEAEAFKKVEGPMVALWQEAAAKGERRFPFEFFYELIRRGELSYDADPADSWLVAAAEKNLPIWTPGWEDSSMGNIYVARKMRGDLADYNVIRSGLEQMEAMVGWYTDVSAQASIGFFQIGGGIAGDFPICVVPLVQQDMKSDCPEWGYFCQISDSTTSFGSYSGAVPNEKITWGKLKEDTPRFVIESDATIVFPLVAAYVLDM